MDAETRKINNNNNDNENGRGRVLLLEHLQYVVFKKSEVGVLLIIFSNGDIFFSPLLKNFKRSLNNNHNSHTSKRKILTSSSLPSSPSSSSSSSSPSSYSSSNDPSSILVYDDLLEPEIDYFQVYSLPFDVKENCHEPHKLLLSPNKRLLLLFGAIIRGQSSLLVYHIEDGSKSPNQFFRLIFFDLSSSFIDVCFGPDSRGLAVIPAQFSSFIFLLNLPIKNQQANINLNSSKKCAIDFCARRAGPLVIVGPGKGVFGQTLHMTHIAVNNYIVNGKNPDTDTYHFVTWNDSETGEYCLWKVGVPNKEKKDFELLFKYYPKLLVPRVTDLKWITDPETPKNEILDIQFNSREHKLLITVRRLNYPRKNDNGIGMQMVSLSNEEKDTTDRYWFQMTESTGLKDVLCVKWTNTLFLGTTLSGACIIRGKGLFELVDYRYSSQFQALYDTFVSDAENFVQLDKYQRFWTDSRGSLHVIVVSLSSDSPLAHPEWSELFTCSRNEQLEMRVLGRRIGYFINMLDPDPNVLEATFLRRIQKRWEKAPTSLDTLLYDGQGTCEFFCGLHLYACRRCKGTVLKPLLCGRCKCVVYCSRQCQIDHWEFHKKDCFE